MMIKSSLSIVYIPGCPPTPEAVMDGIMALQRMIQTRQPRPWKDNWKYPMNKLENLKQNLAGKFKIENYKFDSRCR